MTDIPFGYLFGTALVALATAFALWPVRRPRPLSTISYFLGLALAELPVFALVLLTASSVLAVSEGDVAGPGGQVVLALALLTSVGLAVVLARALPATAVLTAALQHDLGVAPGAARTPRRVPTWLRALQGPVVVRPRNVTRVANIAYGPAGRRQQLDVLHRRDVPQGAPVLVYWHGGGYYSGSKNREARPLLHRLAQRGWVCVSANYRLRPQAGFAEHLADAKSAIAWAHAHAAEFGGDPSTLVVAGSSAGAHLASICALTPDTSVSAAVCLYGWYDSYYGTGPADAPASSPFAYVNPDAPPFFLTHGDHDTYAPVETARGFVRELRDASRQPVVYAELPGAHHAFDVFHSIRSEAVTDAVETFLDVTLRDRDRGVRGSTR
ncbi:esterase/lipase [Beutenbergia cavernae DSM 12333]|uniref:Esterase/lipase n=1 Tax=Beutenbergia cavernae (strain ATCC BAA-8 / DSM 12333 / CCUG 43141 / JCM 11478 / NBRC 16432 / NCIMB 13614 / HKI 0122) TaxID=471853 RepID=C5BWA0_BEUC1|nr:alpha/beta hydrolase [Beutenbergia cavernae]ACQ78558.1 esterase/lipase [Beutenbergia cavernae DSM 12333]